MLQIIGVNDKGDYIVSTTSGIGKTQMELEEISMIMSWQKAQQLTIPCRQSMEAINKMVETLQECLEPLFHEWNQQGKTLKKCLKRFVK